MNDNEQTVKIENGTPGGMAGYYAQPNPAMQQVQVNPDMQQAKPNPAMQQVQVNPAMQQAYQNQGYSGIPFNGNIGSFQVNLPQTDIANMSQQMKMQEEADRKAAKKSKGKRLALIISVIVVLLAGTGVGAYFLFFTPEKKYEKLAKQADTYFEQENYEQAITSYEDLLAMRQELYGEEVDEETIDIWMKEFKAYQGQGDDAKTRQEFDKIREEILSLDDALVESKKDSIIDFYTVGASYIEDENERLEVYKEALGIVEIEMFQAEIANVYNQQAVTCFDAFDYEGAFHAYQNTLEYDPDNQDAINGCARTFTLWVLAKLDMYDYEGAQEMLDTYPDLAGVNYTDLQSSINGNWELYENAQVVFTQALSFMAAGDYDSMVDVDNSSESWAVYNNMNSSSYCYAEDGFTSDYTGTAVGIYKINAGFYYYYGEFVDGKRSGYGVSYITEDEEERSYRVYYGDWADDAPNGHGTMFNHNLLWCGYKTDIHMESDFEHGLQTGAVTGIIEILDEPGEDELDKRGYQFVGHWNSVEGVPEDISDTLDEETRTYFVDTEGYYPYTIYEAEGFENSFYASFKEGSIFAVRGY